MYTANFIQNSQKNWTSFFGKLSKWITYPFLVYFWCSKCVYYAFPIPILLTKMYIRKHCATALAFILSGEKLSYMRSILCHRRCNDMYAGYTYNNISIIKETEYRSQLRHESYGISSMTVDRLIWINICRCVTVCTIDDYR